VVSDGGDYAIVDGAGFIIGEAINIVGPMEFRPAEANARLWSAAPALLEALLALNYPESDGPCWCPADHNKDYHSNGCEQARAAIAAATAD
jgi:hypothetical protein